MMLLNVTSDSLLSTSAIISFFILILCVSVCYPLCYDTVSVLPIYVTTLSVCYPLCYDTVSVLPIYVTTLSMLSIMLRHCQCATHLCYDTQCATHLCYDTVSVLPI